MTVSSGRVVTNGNLAIISHSIDFLVHVKLRSLAMIGCWISTYGERRVAPVSFGRRTWTGSLEGASRLDRELEVGARYHRTHQVHSTYT